MIETKVFESRDEWLRARKNHIGGSDASAVMGMNQYMSNTYLWKIKTGKVNPEDISDKPYVKYGTEAEKHLRELFSLDYPEYTVYYEENNMWLNQEYPWGHYSADGWIADERDRLGILEIKTTEIVRSGQKQQWDGQIPQNYYIQLLHGFAITGAEFAVLKAQIKYRIDNDMWLNTKHYMIERSDVENDITRLMAEEEKFWEYVTSRKEPPLILPSI